MWLLSLWGIAIEKGWRRELVAVISADPASRRRYGHVQSWGEASHQTSGVAIEWQGPDFDLPTSTIPTAG
jgi:hypothetical protein